MRSERVFISYSSLDKPTADKVCELLEDQGVDCWIVPRNLLSGAKYAESIVLAIEQSSAVVLLFSSHSNKLSVADAHETKISKSEGYTGLAALTYAQGRYKQALSYAKPAETLNPEIETETTQSIASVAETVNTSQPIDDVMDHLTEILLVKLRDAYPIQGRIARTTEQGVILNIGLEQGVTPGVTLEVYANDEPVALVQKAVEFPNMAVAIIEVIHVDKSLSRA